MIQMITHFELRIDYTVGNLNIIYTNLFIK